MAATFLALLGVVGSLVFAGRHTEGVRVMVVTAAGRAAAAARTAPVSTAHTDLPSRASPTGRPTAPAARPTPFPQVAAVPAPTPIATPPPAPPAARAPAGPHHPGFVCTAVSGGGAGTARVTSVRVGSHAGYDRLVLSFTGAVPRYDVQPQTTAAFAVDAQGATVQLLGTGGLLVSMQNVANRDSFAGPSDLRPGFPVLAEARHVAGPAGVYQWALGLTHPACFRVTTLDGPPRLVIDVET